MRWKEILIGAAVALTVTVIGGLLVYFFTQEKEESSIEKLTYQIEKQISFDGKNNQVSIGSLKFANIGSEPAKNISAEFRVPTAKILEFKVANKDGADITKKISEDKSSVSLRVKSFLPDEVVSITYLLSREASVEFKIRSENTIGEGGTIYRAEKSRSSILNNFFGDFIPLLMLVAIIPLFFTLKYLRSTKSLGSCKNNFGFVLLHTGQPDEASIILKNAIGNGEDGSHALANYAASLALLGESEKAQKYIEASKFLAKSKHECAVCEFNHSIIEFASGEHEKSYSHFDKALNLSKSEIMSYLDGSEICKKMISQNKDLNTLVSNA